VKYWWQLNLEQISEDLGTNPATGLSSSLIKIRQGEYGLNKLLEAKPRSAFSIFADQFKNIIIWILIGAGLISGIMQEWVDALAIIVIIVLNAIMGFTQEFRAEKSLAALKKLSSPNSKVIRDGQLIMIPSSQIVPGDLVEIEAGDNIPADCRLIQTSVNFKCLEASLTGESVPVEKNLSPLPAQNIALGDRSNMLFMGTSVTSGKGRAIVVETGMQTELGKIAGMLQNIESETTPLQKKLEEFGKWIIIICFILVSIIFVLEFLRNGNLLEIILTAVSLAVAAIPEGLPAVVTIALALGIQRMVKRNVIIRKLPAVETLGCTSVICSDKTGTLTKNEMTVQNLFINGQVIKISGIGYKPEGSFSINGQSITLGENPTIIKALECSLLCNSAALTADFKIVGDPTEGALIVAGAKANLNKDRLDKEHAYVQEIPFDSVRKKMTVIRSNHNQSIAYVKGAPEAILNDCVAIEENGTNRPLSAEDKNEILQANEQFTNHAMRVLAVAYRALPSDTNEYSSTTIEKELIFLGLFAMIDPPREEVKKAIADCKSAGIRTIMITGDHKNTAMAIALQLGIASNKSIAIAGEELDKMSDQQLLDNVNNITVYARVSPENKLRIVRTLRQKGAVVAMTGDGVNDAPALKEANIGVAMGITGTDVTKEVSDMIITDDNFTSIVAAVEEGRGIYSNIRKFIQYLLSCNAGEILVMFIATVVGWPAPLIPVQILWINLVTDGLPALALGVDPASKNIMHRPPRPINEAVITRQRALVMLLQGAMIAFCSLSAFAFVLFVENEPLARARTAAFIVLSCSQIFHSFNCRSHTQSLFKIGVFTNPQLIYAAIISLGLQMAVIYIPALQAVFNTENLGYIDWLMVIILSSLPLWGMEMVKRLKRQG